MYKVTLYAPQSKFKEVINAITENGGGDYGSRSECVAYRIVCGIFTPKEEENSRSFESIYEITFPCEEKYINEIMAAVDDVLPDIDLPCFVENVFNLKSKDKIYKPANHFIKGVACCGV